MVRQRLANAPSYESEEQQPERPRDDVRERDRAATAEARCEAERHADDEQTGKPHDLHVAVDLSMGNP